MNQPTQQGPEWSGVIDSQSQVASDDDRRLMVRMERQPRTVWRQAASEWRVQWCRNGMAQTKAGADGDGTRPQRIGNGSRDGMKPRQGKTTSQHSRDAYITIKDSKGSKTGR